MTAENPWHMTMPGRARRVVREVQPAAQRDAVFGGELDVLSHARNTTTGRAGRQARAVQQFSPEHVAALVAIAAAMLRPPPPRVLAVAMAGAFVAEQVAYVVTGEWRATLNLPLQLSDAVTFVAILAFGGRPRPRLAEAAVVLGAHRVAAGDARRPTSRSRSRTSATSRTS